MGIDALYSYGVKIGRSVFFNKKKRGTSLESYRSYLQYKFEGFHYAYIRSTELAPLFLQKLLFRGPHRTRAVIRNNSQLTV